MSKKWPGGIITPTPATPKGPYQTGAAPGIWTIQQADYWIKQGLWPVAGNSATWFSASNTGDLGISLATSPTGNVSFSYRTTGDAFALLSSGGASATAGAYLAYAQGEGDITYDSSGNIYNCTYNNSSQTQLYVAKYTSAGVNTWVKTLTMSGVGYYTQPKIAVDSSGNVFLCGTQTNTAQTIYSVFVIKLDSTGALVWSYYYTPSPTSNLVYQVGKPAFDASGNLYIGGGASGGILVLFRVTTGGTMNVNYSYSGIDGGSLGSVVIDSAGYIYVSGSRPSPNQPALIKFDPAALTTPLWAYYINDPSGDFVRTSGNGLAVDTTDNSVYLGNFYTYNAPSRAAVAKFTSSGTLSWVRSLGIGTSTTRPAATNSVAAYGGLWYYNLWPTTYAGPVTIFQSLSTGAGTGTAGTYSYNSVTTSLTAITVTPSVYSMSRTSFTPTIANSTSTSLVPTMTKTSL